ncbi:MAG: competence/damage-inducible protein A [Bacteroidia bacterium]|nr:competence/damage-inducible protein A [Bacteroidia bacterium]
MISADIITIGDEILIGQITDTNSAYIARELNAAGIRIRRKYSIGDQKEAITGALDESIGQVDAILFTGGLGPTNDDITKHTLNAYFGSRLVRNQETFDMLAAWFAARNRTFEPVNQGQADVPEVCTVMLNKLGTAPGMIFEKEGTHIFCMPGVPYEMEGLMQSGVLPFLKQKYALPPLAHHTVLTAGIPESTLMMQIKDWEEALPAGVKLAYLPSYGAVKLRLTAWEPGTFSEVELAEIARPLYGMLGDAIYGTGDRTMEEIVFTMLKEKKLRVSFAESCTGGFLAHRLTSMAGSSMVFNGSVVTYSYEAKTQELQVPSEILMQHGAVSEPVVMQMAEAVKIKFDAEYGVATSGIAGPDGGTPEKPVGTVWIAVSGPQGTKARRFLFTNNRERNIRLTCLHAYNMLRKML